MTPEGNRKLSDIGEGLYPSPLAILLCWSEAPVDAIAKWMDLKVRSYGDETVHERVPGENRKEPTHSLSVFFSWV